MAESQIASGEILAAGEPELISPSVLTHPVGLTPSRAAVPPHEFSPRRSSRTRARFTPTQVRTPVPRVRVSANSRRGWLRRYQVGLLGVDALAGAAGAAIAFELRFGATVTVGANAVFAVALPVAWVLMVCLNGGYDRRFVGVGAAEFQRVVRAFLHLTAMISFSSFALHADVARGFILFALPLALATDLAARYAARKWLHHHRRRGNGLISVLLVGDADSITSFSTILKRDIYAGMRPVGACVPSSMLTDEYTLQTLAAADIALVGDIDSIKGAVRSSNADTVAVVSSPAIGPDKLRWISWQLEGSCTSLVVSPGLTDVAGPRLHVQPVAGLPLLHVEEPQFTGAARLAKATFDRSMAALAIVVLAPLLLSLWAAVKFTSDGPGFFRQTRVGRNGQTFTMIKFRSMFADAETRLKDLGAANVNGDGLLFKVPNDPRVTQIGRLLRKLSLDELPQLFNVLSGRMSLVGPRPPLPSEVAQYGEDVRRRLLVPPGLTGLWQISGRSDLPWDESVRLDLGYVENWSFALDLAILLKTVGAVVRGSGAY